MGRTSVIACAPCRARKRKCNGELPCLTCVKSRNGPSSCFYDDKLPQKRKRPEDQEMVASAENNQVLEASGGKSCDNNLNLPRAKRSQKANYAENSDSDFEPEEMVATKPKKELSVTRETLTGTTGFKEPESSDHSRTRSFSYSDFTYELSTPGQGSTPIGPHGLSNPSSIASRHSIEEPASVYHGYMPSYEPAAYHPPLDHRHFAYDGYLTQDTHTNHHFDDQYYRDNHANHHFDNPPPMVASTHSISSRNEEGQFNGSVENSNEKRRVNGPMNEESTSRLISILDENIQNHLRSLSFLFYCGVDVLPNLSYCIPMFRPDTISTSLSNAIYYHASFISNHPGLFRSRPTIKERMAVAARFEANIFKDPSLLVYSQFSSHSELCDNTRAILLHATTKYLLNDFFGANELLAKAFHICRLMGITHPSIFGEHNSSTIVDDVTLCKLTIRECAKPANEHERLQRLAVLKLLLAVDTMLCTAAGQNFLVDDAMIPKMSMDVECKSAAITKPFERQFERTCGKYTIWQNTELGLVVDDTRELSLSMTSFQIDSEVAMKYLIELIRFTRQLMRFARSQRLQHGSTETMFFQYRYQCEILGLWARVPNEVIQVRSLVPYLWTQPECDYPQITNRATEVTKRTLSFLLMFNYLHYTSACTASSAKFPLELNGEVKYTSIDVMFAVYRALCHVIQISHEHCVGSSDLLEADPMHSHGVWAKSDFPSPVFCEAQITLTVFLLTTSVLQIFKSPTADSYQAHFVYSLTCDVVLPLFKKLENVWPIAAHYTPAIETLLTDFPFWNSKESY